MSCFRTLRRLAVLAALLPLGACYVAPGAVAPYGAPGAVAPYGTAEPSGTVYAPPPQGGGYVGTTCSAGAYVCPVAPGPLGAQCSCPGLGAPSFGVIR